MVNDLEKLKKVIDSLEEQSSQVEKFNGVLQAVNDASFKIAESKSLLTSLASEHRQLIESQAGQFEEFLQRYGRFEEQLVEVHSSQRLLADTIDQLDMVSSGQFQQGQEKVLSSLAKLHLAVHTLQEEQHRASREALNNAVDILARQIGCADQAQRASIRLLQVITVVGLLMLMAGTAAVAFTLLQ